MATLSTSGFLGVYAYRSLVRSLHNRAAELPLATELAQKVSDLRVSVTAPAPASQTDAQPIRNSRPISTLPAIGFARISTPSNRPSKTIAINSIKTTETTC